MTEILPSEGLKAIKNHWKDDLPASISVALVALPLALGIAIASGAPPMSGILAAIIGGVITTFFRSSYVAINGPAAGLIVVVFTGVQALGDEYSSGFQYALAAIVVAGVIQMALGLLRMGKLGDVFPVAVINGMLATIGIIIFVKQFHVALGDNGNTGSIMNALMGMPHALLDLNPAVTIISIISLGILIGHPYITNKSIKSIPAPLLVLMASVPLVFLSNLFDKSVLLFGKPLSIGQEFLIQIPDNLLDNIIFPNFSKIDTSEFWLLVISITLVASIETLISTKAVDKLDHFKRRTDLNKDLFAVGLSTAVSGCLGGLPIITVIVRSSVNMNHHAKTKMSNFYHGIILLLFVFLFPFIIREIPLASLASILVYTGYKLASPRLFKATALKGWEQVFIMLCTLVASLAIDILWGIILGMVSTLLIQWLRSGLHIKTFVKHLFNTEIKVTEEQQNVYVDIKGIANFAIMLKLINSLKSLNKEKHSIVNFSRTKLIDSTILDFIHEHREKYFTQSDLEFTGLDVHKTSSPHPLALHVLEKPMRRRLSSRQNDMLHYAQGNKYRFLPEIDWHVDHFEKFLYFEFHNLDYQRNRLKGSFTNELDWIISDITFTDGVMMAREEHHTTIMHMNSEQKFKSLLVTKEDIQNIKDVVKRGKKRAIPELSEPLKIFLSKHASFYIEVIENEILIYRKERLLSVKEIIYLHDFAENLLKLLPSK